MRVVAAKFPGPEQAWAVLSQLHKRLNVDPPDVEVAPLGVPGQASANEFLLAGRFEDECVARVEGMVRDGGGVVVANVDEIWTGTEVHAET